jgi:hypothetical protein
MKRTATMLELLLEAFGYRYRPGNQQAFYK